MRNSISKGENSPTRLFIITIAAIFMAEVVAMIVVYFIGPLPYHLTTLIDAGIMLILIFPVLYYFSFRPLIRQMRKSWQAEESLLRSKELQEKFFDSIDTLIAYMDRDFNFVRVNDAYAKAGGYPTEYFTGKNHFVLYPHTENEKIFQRVVKTGEGHIVLEKPFEYPDQPERGVTYWNWSLQPVKNLDGNVEGLVLSLVEVTERKRAEDRLRKSYEELELRVQERTEELRIANSELAEEIVERKSAEDTLRHSEAILLQTSKMAKVGGWELDLQTMTTLWSLETYRIHEVDPSTELQLDGAIDFYPPEARPLIAEAVRRAMEDGQSYDLELPLITAKGNQIWIRTIGETELQHGKCVRLFGTIQDITERKHAEEQLRYQAALLSNVNDAIVAADAQFHITAWNAAAESLYGWKAEEVIGRNGLEIVCTEWTGKDPDEMRRTITETGRWRGEATQIRKDGSRFPVEVSSIVLYDDNRQINGYISVNRDITERKETEAALRESEAKYRNLFENMTEEVHFWQLVRDEAGCIKTWQLVDANPPALKSWNRETVDEIRGKTTDEIFGPGSTEHYLPVVQKITTDGLPHSFEDYFVHLDKHFRFTSVPLGEYFITTGADITTIKKAEGALRAARDELELRVQQRTAELGAANRELVKEIAERKEIERQLRIQTTAMEAAANGIVITDREGRIQWINPALVQISGYDMLALMGQKMQIFNSGRHGRDYYRQMWDTILSGQVWRGEITNRRKDGSFYMEEQTITPVRDEQGQITQFISIKQDITERKQAEAALRESEEKFRTLVEWTYDWEIWLDPSGNIVYNSPACERITGYSPEEIRSTPDFMLRILHPDDSTLYKDHRQLVHIESVGPETIDYRIVTRDGKERWIQHVCRPLFGADHRYLGRRISNRDITERKQAERDIQERNQKEKVLTQTIHTMQLDIARDLHDTIGQNISFLRMKLDYLAERKIRKHAEMQIELRNMARAANESYDLMRGTLAMLQSEDSTDLFRLFTRYAEQIKERSSFKIDLCTQGEPRFVSAKRMRQLFYIFREILNNIEKHSNASQVTIQMTWESDCLKLLVFDNGSGFDLDSVQYGSHYGLRFMRERVELLNGSILIRSAIGSGTDIIVQIPYE